MSAIYADSPQKRIDLAKYLILLSRSMLPCPKCRRHLAKNLEMYNMVRRLYDECESAEDAFRVTWELHNIVNRQLGKPQIPLHEAREQYAPCDVCQNV